MDTRFVPKRTIRPAPTDFLTQLGIPVGSTDASRLMRACQQLHTINQVGDGLEWEVGCRGILQGLIQGICKKYSLYCIFETSKDGPPVRFAHKLNDVTTMKLIGANVWAW